MDKTLRFWVDAEYGARKSHYPKLSKKVARILREFEGCGDANGKITWKASPRCLERLADAEREAEDELDDRV